VSDLGEGIFLLIGGLLLTCALWGHWRGWFLMTRRLHSLRYRRIYVWLPSAVGVSWLGVVAIAEALLPLPERVFLLASLPSLVLLVMPLIPFRWPRWLVPDWELRYERELHRLRLAHLDELDQAEPGRRVRRRDVRATRAQAYEDFDDLRSIEYRDQLEERAAVELAAIEASRARRRRRRR
jgi:hypothetical protein